MAKMISFEALQPLIEELTRDKPNQVRIKKLMLTAGLDYVNDPIQQMSTVLTLMSHISPGMQKAKSKEKVSEV